MESEKNDNTISLISKVRRSANELLSSEMAKRDMRGLVPSHGEILVALLEIKELTMMEIAKQINRNPSTVTALVSKLKKNGYLTTRKADYCRRTTLVSLTKKGEGLRASCSDISKTLVETYSQNISREDFVVFRQVLEQILVNLESREGGSADE